MNDRDIENVLAQAASSLPVHPKFNNPSALVKETAGRHRRERQRLIFGFGTVVATAAALVISFGPGTEIPLSRQAPPSADRYDVSGDRIITLTDQQIYNSVEAMADASEIVVRGIVEQRAHTWNLSRDVQDPTKEAEPIQPGTDYRINVVQYLKGSGSNSAVVNLPGGEYKGVKKFEEVELGKEYVLFLVPHRDPNRLTPDGQQRYGRVSAHSYFEIRDGMACPIGVASPIKPVPFDELVQKVKQTIGKE